MRKLVFSQDQESLRSGKLMSDPKIGSEDFFRSDNQCNQHKLPCQQTKWDQIYKTDSLSRRSFTLSCPPYEILDQKKGRDDERNHRGVLLEEIFVVVVIVNFLWQSSQIFFSSTQQASQHLEFWKKSPLVLGRIICTEYQ